MSSARSNSLQFYALLRDQDLANPSVLTALAFARIARDLLMRIAASWAVQRGLSEVPGHVVPSLLELFRFAIDPAGQPLTGPDATDNPTLQMLLHETGAWLLGGFNTQDPFSSSYQVWVGETGSRRVVLAGPFRTSEPPDGILLEPAAGRKLADTLHHAAVAVIGHYDVHGLTMLGLSLRSLRHFGVQDAHGVLGFEQSGDIGKLWKRTVPQALKHGGEGCAVVLIDCPVHSRTPEHTLRALRGIDNLPGSRVVIVDHHPDTIELAPVIAKPGVQLVLTDVLSCALLGVADEADKALRVLGAIGDKVPEVAAAFPVESNAKLYLANDVFQEALLHFSPTPKELKALGKQPCEPLWELLAGGASPEADLVAAVLPGNPPRPAQANLPASHPCGAMLFVTERLTVLGRSWYALLESLMEKSGRSYAVALRVLDGNRANMLLLTHWRHTHMPPVRSFIPESYWPRCLGHPAAVWVDLDKRDALAFLEAVAGNVNAFFDSAADFSPIAELLRKNILEQAPSVYGSPIAADQADAL